MKKCVLSLWALVLIICLCYCGSNNLDSTIENKEGSNGVNSEDYQNSFINGLQPGWEYLNWEIFNDEVSATNEIYFLIAKEISLKGQFYKTDENNTNKLLKLFQNLQVKKTEDVVSDADYYILFRNKNDVAVCLIEVWDNYICINQGFFYEVLSDEVFLAIDKMVKECEEVNKVPAEEILLAYTKMYGEFNKEDIVLYNKQPAILVESGYESNFSDEKLYYEKYVYCEGMYFDIDYQTSYMLSQCKIYYYENGSVKDVYSERVAYYDFFTGERMQFVY